MTKPRLTFNPALAILLAVAGCSPSGSRSTTAPTGDVPEIADLSTGDPAYNAKLKEYMAGIPGSARVRRDDGGTAPAAGRSDAQFQDSPPTPPGPLTELPPSFPGEQPGALPPEAAATGDLADPARVRRRAAAATAVPPTPHTEPVYGPRPGAPTSETPQPGAFPPGTLSPDVSLTQDPFNPSRRPGRPNPELVPPFTSSAASPPSDVPHDSIDLMVNNRAAAAPSNLSSQLDAALVGYLRGQVSPDPVRVGGLPAEDREIISAVIDALVNLRAFSRTEPNATFQTRAKPFLELGERLGKKTGFSVPTIAMTSAVTSFGVYEPMPAAISSRADTPTVLYVEAANFTSRLNPAGQWETRLTSDVTLYNSANRAVWTFRPPPTTDLCRNRRQDFFLPALVRIPPQPAGRYALKVTLTDANVGTLAENVLPLDSR